MRAHEISISNHDIGGNEYIFDIVDIIDTDMRFFKKIVGPPIVTVVTNLNSALILLLLLTLLTLLK